MADFIYLMETRLSPDQQRAVALVTNVARAHDMNIFLTGGAVRDILSGFVIRDLDFSVQGNALKLQKDFEKAGAVTEATDEPTRTIMLLLPVAIGLFRHPMRVPAWGVFVGFWGVVAVLWLIVVQIFAVAGCSRAGYV